MTPELFETLMAYIDAKVEAACRDALGQKPTKEVLQKVEVLQNILRDMVWKGMNK